MTWSVLDIRREARTPARCSWISCFCFYFYIRHVFLLELLLFYFLSPYFWPPWYFPVWVESLCCFRVTQEVPLSARWKTGPGSRLEWWVSEWAVLPQTSQACTRGWPATRASSPTQYQKSPCMAKLTRCGVGGQPCCSAVCPPCWSCCKDKPRNMKTEWKLAKGRQTHSWLIIMHMEPYLSRNVMFRTKSLY